MFENHSISHDHLKHYMCELIVRASDTVWHENIAVDNNKYVPTQKFIYKVKKYNVVNTHNFNSQQLTSFTALASDPDVIKYSTTKWWPLDAASCNGVDLH